MTNPLSQKAWFLHRGNRYYSQFGWVTDPARALRYTSQSDAEASLADLRKENPKLMAGDVQAVVRDWHPFGHLGVFDASYDPYGLRRV